jgi:hypothetical protein
MNYKLISLDILNIILQFDGRIKYKNGKYINIIHKYDKRYNIVELIINKKIKIIQSIVLKNDFSFYFEFNFDFNNRIGLCYDYNFSCDNIFEICYYDMRNDWNQIRTYL